MPHASTLKLRRNLTPAFLIDFGLLMFINLIALLNFLILYLLCLIIYFDNMDLEVINQFVYFKFLNYLLLFINRFNFLCNILIFRQEIIVLQLFHFIHNLKFFFD